MAAFGPPRGDASENVSVVKSKLPGRLSLRSLGEPKEAAQRLLDTAIAPEGSGKVASLIDAIGETRGSESYQLVRRRGWMGARPGVCAVCGGGVRVCRRARGLLV